jgi:hypothetical protein
MQRLTDAVAQGDDEPDDQEQPEPAPVPGPPAPAVRGGGGMVDWWNARNAGEDEKPEKPAAGPCAHPNPHAVRARPTGQLIAFWCADCQTQLAIPDDYDELADVADGEGDADGEVPAKVRRQWSMRGSGKKTYNRPVHGTGTSPKKSLIEAWGGLRPATRHGLYNGTSLAIAWQLNIPQFFTQETAYLVHAHHSWTSFEVCIWYGVAIAIWAFDHHTRNWLPPFALLARMPLISLVVGVLLYGNPL